MILGVLVWKCRCSDRKPISPAHKALKSASVEVSVSSITTKVCTILYQPVSTSVKKDYYTVLRSDSLSHEMLQQRFFPFT